MTDEDIFEISGRHGWMDDFGRWNFTDDGLIGFALEIKKAEWVGLATGEAREFYESDLSREELIHKIDEFLQEKNT